MKRIISSVLLLASLIACDKDDNSYNNFSLSSVRMDIADAQMLVLCGNEVLTKSSADDLSLFKIDKDGNMTAVRSMVDGTNEEVRLVPKAYGHLMMSIYFVHGFGIIDRTGLGFI